MTADLQSDLQATCIELYPHKSLETLTALELTVALGVLLRREMLLSRRGSLAGLTTRNLDQISRHNPKDPE